MLGPNQPIILHMLDIELAAEALEGVKMELIDSACPLLKGNKFLLQLDLFRVVSQFLVSLGIKYI